MSNHPRKVGATGRIARNTCRRAVVLDGREYWKGGNGGTDEMRTGVIGMDLNRRDLDGRDWTGRPDRSPLHYLLLDAILHTGFISKPKYTILRWYNLSYHRYIKKDPPWYALQRGVAEIVDAKLQLCDLDCKYFCVYFLCQSLIQYWIPSANNRTKSSPKCRGDRSGRPIHMPKGSCS